LYINVKIFKIYTINNYIMDYNSKTVQELKNICKINKYKGYSKKKTKKDLIEFIKNKTNTTKLIEGQKVIYKTTGELVTIVKKHFDDIPPYYTIRMSNGNERQTVEDKLSV
tara:strand:- start:222 stop:554 length:333 start_codon:yes stop_codon:yes gene_type:complete